MGFGVRWCESTSMNLTFNVLLCHLGFCSVHVGLSERVIHLKTDFTLVGILGKKCFPKYGDQYLVAVNLMLLDGKCSCCFF